MFSIVYLAGPITGLTHVEAVGWRRTATHDLEKDGLSVRDPMRETPRPIGGGAYDDDPSQLFLKHDPYERDMNDISICDIVLFNFLHAERVSIGSCWELGYAVGLGGKYIVVAVEPNGWHDHYFVQRTADVVVPTLHEAVEAVKERAQDAAELLR